MRHLTHSITIAAVWMLTATHAWCQDPQPQPAEAEPPAPPAMPFVHVDVKNKRVDVEATVANRSEALIELLACTVGTRDYESLLATKARPSHVHLALLLLGLEPGAPLSFHEEPSGRWVAIAPRGPRVAVTLLYEKDGKQIEEPASRWIVEHDSDKQMPDNLWLFTGSRFNEVDGKQVYAADALEGGSLISLINFGDDVLARPTDMGNRGGAVWAANEKQLPAVGTAVTIRLEPATAEKDQE